MLAFADALLSGEARKTADQSVGSLYRHGLVIHAAAFHGSGLLLQNRRRGVLSATCRDAGIVVLRLDFHFIQEHIENIYSTSDPACDNAASGTFHGLCLLAGAGSSVQCALNRCDIAVSTVTVIAVVGPTCTGKTALAVRLAQILDGEVLGCDSRTVYRYMDIGTAKPTMAERHGVPHHMFDLVDPDETYTAGRFKREAGELIDNLLARGKAAIVVGGTGLYARALLEGFSMPEVAPDMPRREALENLAREKGIEALHEILRQLDPLSLSRIMPNDRFRIIRAIEVSEILGKPFSEAATVTEPRWNVVWLGLDFSRRELLKERIVERLGQQLSDGVIEETSRIREKYGLTRALLNAVPYKEYLRYLDGLITLEEATEEAVKHNYELARRQLMWFRSNKKMHWIDASCNSPDQVLAQALDLIEKGAILDKR